MQFRATHFMSLQNALYSIPSVQHTLCHCERKNGVPAGYRVPVEKKAQTSIRVSVIAPDNVISKAQFAP